MPGPAGAPGTPRATASDVQVDTKSKGKGKGGTDVFYIGEEVRFELSEDHC